MREKDVLGLDIPVSIAFAMHVVKTIHHLVEISSGHFLGELACVCYVIEELSSTHVLENNSETLVGIFVSAFISGIFSHINEFHEIFMVQDLHYTELML